MSANKIRIAPYSLRLLRPFGVAQSFERRGVLVEVNCDEGIGYSCLQPWPELGEPTLEELLQSLKADRPVPIAQRALEWARTDARISKAGGAGFAGLDLGESHYLLDSDSLMATSIASLKDRGFSVFKVKADLKIGERLNFLASDSGLRSGLKFRLDFNARLAISAADEFLAKFPEPLRAHVDFFEDLTVYDESKWLAWNQRYGARLALDRASSTNVKIKTDERFDKGPAPFVVSVLKPSVEDDLAIRKSAADNMRRIVMTHNLDHAVGRACALWAVGQARIDDPLLIDESGFCGDDVYEPDAYLRRFTLETPKLVSPVDGPHWGFADQLAREDWKPL